MEMKEIKLKNVREINWFDETEVYLDGRVWYFTCDKE